MCKKKSALLADVSLCARPAYSLITRHASFDKWKMQYWRPTNPKSKISARVSRESVTGRQGIRRLNSTEKKNIYDLR